MDLGMLEAPFTHQTLRYIYVGVVQSLYNSAQKLRIWKNLIFLSEIARARTGVMWQLFDKRELWEPHHKVSDMYTLVDSL